MKFANNDSVKHIHCKTYQTLLPQGMLFVHELLRVNKDQKPIIQFVKSLDKISPGVKLGTKS